MSINGLGQTYNVAFAFLQSESEENFQWALESCRTHMPNLPGVVGTDRDLALMNATSRVFSTSAYVLCRWHVNKRVKA